MSSSSVLGFIEYSFVLIFLLILFITVMVRHKTNSMFVFYYLKIFFCVIIEVIFVLLVTNNLFIFYFMFEILIIPIFFIIIGYGYQPEKIKSRFIMYFYTICTSITLLLVMIIMIDFDILYFSEIELLIKRDSSLLFISRLIVLITFLTKVPLFRLHAWLPQAHVEAPVYGSILLASVFLKIGTYGLMRFYWYCFRAAVNEFLIRVSLIGIALISFNALHTTHIKKNVAFTSVIHIAYVVVMLYIYAKVRVLRGLMIMINHAFRASGIFFMIRVFYCIYHSQNLLFIKGLLRDYPQLNKLWFIVIIRSLGIPPIVNFLGEFMRIILTISFYSSYILLIFISWCLVGLYHVIFYR